MIGVLKRGLILFSIFYSGTTILSSSLQLYKGQLTDTNYHIINRAVVVLIAVITIMLFDEIQVKSKVLSYLVPYAMSMGIVFLYVWITGFIEPLHPNAYRDIFFNFTAITIFVMIAIFIKDKWKGNKIKSGE
jgi:hypothetical protein